MVLSARVRLPALLVALMLACASLALASPAGAATKTVSTASGLKAAVKAAKAGDTIVLAKGTYTLLGLELAANGTASQRITLRGSGATITTGSASKGYGIHVTGDYWVITGVTVTKSLKGIVADGATHLLIDGVTVTSVGQEGIHLRSQSTYAVVRNSTISATGTVDKGYGEGIYVGSAKSLWKTYTGSATTPDRSDHVIIENNHISQTPAEGIDIKEGTTSGTVRGNVFTNAGYSGVHDADSWVDVKGNRYVISGNSGTSAKLDAFQTHVQLPGWGRWNSFSGNRVSGVPGYTVRVAPGSTGTVVKCTTLTTGKLGLSNIACS